MTAAGAALGGTLDFRTLFERSPTPMVAAEAHPPDFRVVAVTDAFVRAAATRRPALLGQPLADVVHGLVDPAAFDDALSRTMREPGVPVACTRDGHRGCQLELVTEAGQPGPGHLVLTIDVDGAPATTRLANLFGSRDDAVIVMNAGAGADDDPRIAFVNDGFVRLTGYRPEDALGRSPLFLLGAMMDPVAVERLREGRRKGISTTVEVAIEKRDGNALWIEVETSPLRDASGRITHWIVLLRDITERRALAAAAIRAKDQLLDAIFELLPVGVWIADKNGTIIRTNPAGERIWAGARFVGPSQFHEYRGWWADTGEPLAPDDWAVARALKHGETSIGELIRIQCFDGSFKTILNSALPLYDETGAFSGAAVVNEDVTKLRDIEDALRKAVAGRDDILAVVAHDLRGPLTGIELAAGIVAERAANPMAQETIRRSAQTIDRAAKRMRRMINDLLDISSIDAGTLAISSRSVRPGELVRQIADAHRAEAEARGIHLRVAVEGCDDVTTEADPDRIEQAVGNAIGNALKFTPEGGHVLVRARRDGDDLVLSVEDDGPGIDEALLPHVFDRFWRGERNDRRGAGLGLAIAKGIVEAHGGRIWCESVRGRGTSLSFALPCVAAGEAP